MTRRQVYEKSIMAEDDTEKKTDKKLLSVVQCLSRRLKLNVYSSEGISSIEQTRVILDLPALAIKIKAPGGSAIKVAVTEFCKFLKAVSKIPIISLSDVPEEELRCQFKTFIIRLDVMTNNFN